MHELRNVVEHFQPVYSVQDVNKAKRHGSDVYVQILNDTMQSTKPCVCYILVNWLF